MGLVCALARGVLLSLLLLFFVGGRLGDVWEICSSECFQILLWLVVIMKVELHVG